jgi:hypothetical protein
VRQTDTGPVLVSGGLRRIAEDMYDLEVAEDLAESLAKIPLTCSSEAELAFIADSFGVEVQSRPGTRVAQKMFGSVEIVASLQITPADR